MSDKLNAPQGWQLVPVAPVHWASFDPSFVAQVLRQSTCFDADLIGEMLQYSISAAAPKPEAVDHSEDVRGINGDWSVFVGYLIDKCEGEIIREEQFQLRLADMIADDKYGPLFRRETAPKEQSNDQ